MTSSRCEKIKQLLEQDLNPTYLEIIDESHKHIGHAGAASGGGHFKVIIVAKSFSGLKAITRHQRIYKTLGSMMKSEIHALSIEASAP